MMTPKRRWIITLLSVLSIASPCCRSAAAAGESPTQGTNSYQGALDLIDQATNSGNKQAVAKTGYDFDSYLIPFWSGSTAYDETVLMLKGDGPAEASLLYAPERIISVKSPDLKTEYQEGKDYLIEGRRIILTPDSRALGLTAGEMYPPEASARSCARKSGGNLSISLPDGRHFCEVQLRVTYTHKETGFGDYAPPAFGAELIPKTIAKLQKGEPLKVVFYGDSISAGAEPSGFWNKPPNLPPWTEMVRLALAKSYGSAITVANPSVGGKSSDWGRENASALVAAKNPDLVVIAFGMGDAHAVNNFSPATHKANIKSIMDAARAKNSDCEFLLVSTMLANPEAAGFSGCQESYVEPLRELQNENPGTEFVDVTAACKFVLSRKKFWDVSGNGVNHPGDYLTRVYAQAVLSALVKQQGRVD